MNDTTKAEPTHAGGSPLDGGVRRMEPEREAFEAVMAANGYHLNPACYRDGTYRDTEYVAGWAIWRAAATMQCQPNVLMFDALGQPRTRYVRVSLDGSHCVMRPSEGDVYLQDARDCGDESNYTVADVYLSEREFEDLPEHDGF